MNKYLLLFFMISAIGLSSCLKDDKNDPYQEAQEQFKRDTAIMNKFVADNNLNIIRHESGVFYQILEPGSGNHTFRDNSVITVKYEGRLLNGFIFDFADATPFKSTLGRTATNDELILGWRIGIPLIQKGGKIRLLIPSGYGYGPKAPNKIPANSILDFTIELIDVQ